MKVPLIPALIFSLAAQAQQLRIQQIESGQLMTYDYVAAVDSYGQCVRILQLENKISGTSFKMVMTVPNPTPPENIVFSARINGFIHQLFFCYGGYKNFQSSNL